MQAQTEAAELGRVLDSGAVRAVYQPIVRLDTSEVIAYEALARGPAGSALERPDRLFAAAGAAGRIAELDWACRVAALKGALRAGLERPCGLFVNVEPLTLGGESPTDVLTLLNAAQRCFDGYLEITERALADRPAQLVRAVSSARAQGLGIALDDVGADIRSLAFMPFVRPDVIKLDLRLVQARPDRDIAHVVSAVSAQAERTGAAVLAEGIETPAHQRVALALGATLGQGWYHGRPGELPAAAADVRSLTMLPRFEIAEVRSPFELVARSLPLRASAAPLLFQISRHLEREALALGQGCVVLASFQEARRFTPQTAEMYARLAEACTFVGALGANMPVSPAAGVRGGRIEAGDPLLGEWTIVVVAPHFSGALLAREIDPGADGESRYSFAVTYSRHLVIESGRQLLQRIAETSSEG